MRQQRRKKIYQWRGGGVRRGKGGGGGRVLVKTGEKRREMGERSESWMLCLDDGVGGRGQKDNNCDVRPVWISG